MTAALMQEYCDGLATMEEETWSGTYSGYHAYAVFDKWDQKWIGFWLDDHAQPHEIARRDTKNLLSELVRQIDLYEGHSERSFRYHEDHEATEAQAAQATQEAAAVCS